ncbi:hypothetical protein WMY93_008341 [Mugilogobius chulae]|uniref:Inter-alpha-trypsin inhibitor heavy chain H3 n=1 Tax=Mugilogobius chulae TaxID=88201 RepID=A0AAW0PGX0_9GOBI
MSGLLGVGHLLLWGCLGLLLGLGHGAVLVSPEDTGHTQITNGDSRILQKRSTDKKMVEVHSLTVDCTVTARFAHTVITSKALNKANSSQEIFFAVELPKTAFITNFSMEIEGREYVGVVKEKEKAKKQYEAAVKAGQTAALVRASGRKMEKFSVSVNIAALSNVTFTLTYEELLQRKRIVTNIYEPQGITQVDVESTFLSNELLPLVEKTVTDTKAHILFSPTLEQQSKCPNCDETIINGDFIVKYDVKREKSLGDLQIVNGYFVHYFAPSDLRRLPLNVVFVIDTSGSMSGRKIVQTREAMVSILGDLHEEDHFSIVLFSYGISHWKPTLQQATNQTVEEAKNFIRSLEASGGTNINDAGLTAVEMLHTARRNEQVPQRSADMIILLTDGMPNSGESNLAKLEKNIQTAIGGNMSLYCLGFGNDVDYPFLDSLSKVNKGFARRIYEDSDAALQLQGFYSEVSSPLLMEVELKYPTNTVDLLTTNHFNHLFSGQEIIVAGHLMDNDVDNFLVEVFGNGYEDFQAQGQASVLDWTVTYPDEMYIFGDFTERLWAYLTIQQLLDKSQTGSTEDKDSSKAKALEMSLQYNFVTPLTSMVVTKPESDDPPLVADKLTEAQRQQEEKMAPSRHYQPAPHYVPHTPTYWVDSDPHFLIELPDREDALCFNINNRPGSIFTLVKDKEAGILVNGQIIGEKAIQPDGQIRTYFNRFGIVHKSFGVKLEVSTRDISVFQDGKTDKLVWSETVVLLGPNLNLVLTKERSLTLTFKDSVKFVILLHKVWAKHPYHRDFLGFYTLDSHLMSPRVHGLLGQFYHGIDYEVSDLRPGEAPDKPDATMFVKGHQLIVTRGWQRDFRTNLKDGEKIPCWFIHNNGTGLLDGEADDYLVSGLFQTF